MCVDGAIHDTDGHNPHAHIMLTVRPLDEELKSEKATLLRILDCDDAAGFKKELASKRKNLMELEQQAQKYTSKLDSALQE